MNKGIVSPAKILNDQIVRAAPGYDEIITDQDNPQNQLQQVGIDLRLARAYRVLGKGELMLSKADTTKPELSEMQLVDGVYFFEAGKQYSLDFMEDVTVPEDMAAMVVHRSTINRTIGTVVSGVYDPGFRSSGGCGAIFRPLTDVKIQQGYRMAQVVFFTAESASLYDGQYQARDEETKE